MYRYAILDVFTGTPLEGNPLAVFTDARAIPPEQLQPIAREMNLSETVFVYPGGDSSDARVRIFTPTTELPFAGHPILGTAILLGDPTPKEAIRLETGVGVIEVALGRDDSGRATSGRMVQPVPTWEPFERQAELLAALGAGPSTLPIEVYDNGPKFVMVTLDSEAAVAALEPDHGALTRLGQFGVNCFAGAGTRWKTRMFGPALGVAEDPATGSAAGPVAVHLARHGRIPFGQEIQLHQGAEIGRPSILYARVDGGPDRIERVEVAGSAVVVGRGQLRA